jgi:hypothetical protein
LSVLRKGPFLSEKALVISGRSCLPLERGCYIHAEIGFKPLDNQLANARTFLNEPQVKRPEINHLKRYPAIPSGMNRGRGNVHHQP